MTRNDRDVDRWPQVLELALVRGLVELHGGRVGVTSAGAGTEFTLHLPLERRDTRSPLSESEIFHAAPAPTQHAQRVLVIDDNRDAADTLRDLLELSDHRAQVAYSGIEGVLQAEQFNPEVVLCDSGLPGLDGFGAARPTAEPPERRGAPHRDHGLRP